MLFFNPSLRTRLSTQKAALNLGMNVMVMNFTNEGWTLEFEDGAIMNQGASEHTAAEVVSQYCDIIAIRAFAGLVDKERQCRNRYGRILKYATVPVVNMEGVITHNHLPTRLPWKSSKRIIDQRSFYPGHPKALPQAVANSFCANDAIARRRFCHYTSGRLRTQSGNY
jgi:N-succinyl-L-ornithine transcarbamylase